MGAPSPSRDTEPFRQQRGLALRGSAAVAAHGGDQERLAAGLPHGVHRGLQDRGDVLIPPAARRDRHAAPAGSLLPARRRTLVPAPDSVAQRRQSSLASRRRRGWQSDPPGQRVAITAAAGDQQHRRDPEATVDAVRQAAASRSWSRHGSHGGATAGQGRAAGGRVRCSREGDGRAILSSMEVVELGRTERGTPVYLDKTGRADAILLVNG